MDSNRNGFIATASGCIQLLQCQCSRLQVNLGVVRNPFFETDDPLWVHPNNSRTVFYFLFRLYGFPWNFRYLCICIPKFPHQFSSIFMFIIRFFRSQSNTWHQADHWPHRSIIRIPLHSNFRMWRNWPVPFTEPSSAPLRRVAAAMRSLSTLAVCHWWRRDGKIM